MKVSSIFLNLIQRIKDNLQTAKDYTDSVVASQTNLYSGSWTASSSTANNSTLTQTLTIPSGYYVLCIKTPVFNNSSFALHFLVNDQMVNDLIFSTTSGGSCVMLKKFANASNTIYARSSQSASCTFSYLERGGIYALKIAEVGI